MNQTFYNDLRKPTSAKSLRISRSARSSSNKNTLINYNKREKLKELLVVKFMKKYHLRNNEPFIEEEVKNFLHKEVLNETDLKKLDSRIGNLLEKKKEITILENNLKNDEVTLKDIENEKKRLNSAQPDLRYCNDDEDKRSVRSALSGASKLSQAKPKKKDLTMEDIDNMSVTSHREPVARIQFANEKDEWNAINKYNQQMFLQDKIKEKLKDNEIKRRTKEDLDNQIKQKLLLQKEERLKIKEYDKITIDHVGLLNKLEQERQKEKLDKMIREKENRDAQRLDEKKRKKIEEYKNRKYEKELCKQF